MDPQCRVTPRAKLLLEGLMTRARQNLANTRHYYGVYHRAIERVRSPFVQMPSHRDSPASVTRLPGTLDIQSNLSPS